MRNYVSQLEKEKQALLEEREKLLERIEKLELENQALVTVITLLLRHLNI
ncbi:hypothetical protein [Thermococcus sp. JCM 11816]